MIEKDFLKVLTYKDSYELAKKTFEGLYDYTGYGLDVLNSMDQRYFNDPASTKYHNCFRHGLLYHSINIAVIAYKNLLVMRSKQISGYINSLSDVEFEQYCKEAIFVGLFHDYCKIGVYRDEPPMTDPQFYKIQQECLRHNIDHKKYISRLGKTSGSVFIDKLVHNKLIELDSITSLYEYEDDFKVGHGEKSCIQLLRLKIDLTDHQLLSIRYHMYYYDPLYETINKHDINKAVDEIPMLRAIILAELYSGFIFERRG